MATIITDIFVDLEKCFEVRFYKDEFNVLQENWERVGVELNYSPPQLSLAAHFAAFRYVNRKLLETIEQIGSAISATGGKALKRTKAGSAEVEYEQKELKNNPFVVQMNALLAQLKEDIIIKGLALNCPCGLEDMSNYSFELPLLTLSDPNYQYGFF